jgi:hypothetical protein
LFELYMRGGHIGKAEWFICACISSVLLNKPGKKIGTDMGSGSI